MYMCYRYVPVGTATADSSANCSGLKLSLSQGWGAKFFFTHDMVKSKGDDWQPDAEWISLAPQVDSTVEAHAMVQRK